MAILYYSNIKNKINARILRLGYSSNKFLGKIGEKATFSLWLLWGSNLKLNARRSIEILTCDHLQCKMYHIRFNESLNHNR